MDGDRDNKDLTVDLGLDRAPLLGAGHLDALTGLREFLEHCWHWTHRVHYESGFNRSEPKPALPSTYMCRHTAKALLDLLDRIDPTWRLAGGTMACNDGREPQPHWWIENDQVIVDMTADQFGWGNIVIAPVDDARYVHHAQAGHRSNINRLGATLDQWKGVASRDWMEHDPLFQAVAAKSAAAYQAFCRQWTQAMQSHDAKQAMEQPTSRRKAGASP